MDELVDRYSMPIDLSDIQPFQRLRDLMGFYTTEASRALVDLAKYRAHRRHLQGKLKRRRSIIMRSASDTKWRADAEAANDPRIVDIQDQLDNTESVIEILDALQQTYVRNYDALSRELTARTGDRDRYYGRGGMGK